MEDLQSLMACLDDISSKIGDGMYLDMADKLKRIHDKLNGDKPFHEDSFYYSDDDSELDSNSDDDSDYDSDYNERARRQVAIQMVRDHLLDYVRSMHQVWVEVQKWEKKVKKVIPLIKRMSPVRKAEAIHAFILKCYDSGKVEDTKSLIGNISGYTFREAWTWERLVDNGLQAIVMEIGTEEEKKRKNMHYDDLSLATLKKLPAFEKKIYDDYQYGYNEEVLQNRREANAKVRVYEESMQRWEMCAKEEERKLRELGARVYDRDRWDAEAHDFWVDDINGRLVNGP
jgi:hypothetical protein